VVTAEEAARCALYRRDDRLSEEVDHLAEAVGDLAKVMGELDARLKEAGRG
jgi:hypothetical protein